MNEPSSAPSSGAASESFSAQAKASELQRAFDVFNQVSAELTQAYGVLQGKVASLTEELAVANGELRRQYEEKQALSERLSSLLNALPAGVVVLDRSAHVTDANPAACDMLGQDLPGRHWAEVTESSLQPTLTIGEWTLAERRLNIAESALPSAGGKILLVHDVSAAHQMKAELERNQRLAAMGEMAASLAHQLRTPLATALLYSANLSAPELGEEARSRFAGKVSAQLQRLERLIQDVLLFARGEHIGRDRIVLAELLAETSQTVEPLMRAQGLSFVLADQAGEVLLIGSRKALFGALVSLLENALQATPEGGQVSLTAHVEAESVRIVVEDSGPGISPELQARIFEPFFTTRGQGTGLGLAIALGVARAHGGGIEVHSEPGKGASFALALPRFVAEADQQHSEQER